MKKEKRTICTVRAPVSLKKRISALADANRRSVSAQIVTMLESIVDEPKREVAR